MSAAVEQQPMMHGKPRKPRRKAERQGPRRMKDVIAEIMAHPEYRARCSDHIRGICNSAYVGGYTPVGRDMHLKLRAVWALLYLVQRQEADDE